MTANIEEGNIWLLKKDLSLEIECFGMVVPVFEGC